MAEKYTSQTSGGSSPVMGDKEFVEHKFINKGGYPAQDPQKYPTNGGLWKGKGKDWKGDSLPIRKVGKVVKSVKDR